MTESQRKHLFKDLFHAVDEIGSTNQYKDCREKWRQLGKPWNLTDQQIAAVRQEGIDEGWEQPAVAATMDQKEKTNRFDWIRTMNETKSRSGHVAVAWIMIMCLYCSKPL